MSISTVDQLRTELESKYTIKCFIDLAEITVSPQKIYQLFDQLYQTKYSDNDRLVFYTSYSISEKLFQHIYDAAKLIDISNCFVLFCSNATDISVINISAQQGSTDLNLFDIKQTNIQETKWLKNDYHLPDTICPLPWMHSEIRHNGDVFLCCVSSIKLGNLSSTPVNEIFQQETITQIRQQFLNGEKPEGCNSCWKKEATGLSSFRKFHISLLQQKLLTKYIDNPTITSLDIKPGNTCNFKCRICSPTSSSRIAQESLQFKGIPLRANTEWFEHDIIDLQFDELLESLNNIDMYGGEPWLIKKFARLLNVAVEQGFSSNIRLHFNSNGSIYPTHLIDIFKYFKHVDVQFSIDNVGARFELERGGDWLAVEKNILDIQRLGLSNVKLNVMPSVNIMNVLYLDEVIDWAKQHRLEIFWNYVNEPVAYSLRSLTKNAKILITNKFKNSTDQELQSIVKTINSYPDNTGEEFIALTRYYDTIRNEIFSESHPEIALAMGYTV